MPNFAIHDNQTVLNVIKSSSKEIAEAVTHLKAVQTNGEPWIGWIWDEILLSWVNPSDSSIVNLETSDVIMPVDLETSDVTFPSNFETSDFTAP